MLSVIGDRLAVDSRRAVLAHSLEGLFQRRDIQIVIQCRQPLLWILASNLRYPLLFRAHDFRSLSICHVSHQRFRMLTAPFPTPRLRATPFAGFLSVL